MANACPAPRPQPGRKIALLRVISARHTGQKHAARLHAGSLALKAAIGRAGITGRKREGDGATPAGRFGLLGAYLRRDRGPRVAMLLTTRYPGPDSGWCDDPGYAQYNRPVSNRFRGSHETLWRDDAIYDFVLVLDYNIRPRIRNRGSAIFFHLARDGYPATEGCVAVEAGDMRRLLPRLSRKTRLVIGR